MRRSPAAFGFEHHFGLILFRLVLHSFRPYWQNILVEVLLAFGCEYDGKDRNTITFASFVLDCVYADGGQLLGVLMRMARFALPRHGPPIPLWLIFSGCLGERDLTWSSSVVFLVVLV